MSDTEPTATAPSLREQLVAAIDDYPVACWTPGNLADRVLAVILPHGKFLGDMHRESEVEVTRLRTTLDEVLNTLVGSGGVPPTEADVDRWRAVLHPPQPTGDDGPSVREAAADDRRYWDVEKAGE